MAAASRLPAPRPGTRDDWPMWSTHDQPLETLRMRIELPSEVPQPTWPEGSHVRGFHASDAE